MIEIYTAHLTPFHKETSLFLGHGDQPFLSDAPEEYACLYHLDIDTLAIGTLVLSRDRVYGFGANDEFLFSYPAQWPIDFVTQHLFNGVGDIPSYMIAQLKGLGIFNVFPKPVPVMTVGTMPTDQNNFFSSVADEGDVLVKPTQKDDVFKELEQLKAAHANLFHWKIVKGVYTRNVP